MATKASPHYQPRYGTWLQTVSKIKSHLIGLKIGQRLGPLINVRVEYEGYILSRVYQGFSDTVYKFIILTFFALITNLFININNNDNNNNLMQAIS